MLLCGVWCDRCELFLKEGKLLDLMTPKIDKALEMFKRKALQSSSDTSNTLATESDLDKTVTDKQVNI